MSFCKICQATNNELFYASIKTYCKEHWKEKVRANRVAKIEHYRKTVVLPSVPIVIERNHWPHWRPYEPMWVTCGPDDYSRVTCSAQSGLAVSYCGHEV